ncbi:MAG: hypothetical protein D6749_12275 [Chloroflexota bacterium]|nr:MAG: hypothetical protein D6749_12275 [Chloroflexota bacterium]
MLSLCLVGVPAAAQSAPPCQNRQDLPYQVLLCPEVMLEDFTAHGDLAAISSLAFAPDGALYFTSPARRAVYRLAPDGEGFFGEPQLIATLSESPFGIAYAADEGALYVAAEQSLFRVLDGAVQPIYRDPETLWHGELHLGADGRLYVARNTADGAALISLARNGRDMRVVATGLRQVFGFTWQGPTLVIADAAESALYTVESGALVRLAELPAESAPHGIIPYTSEAISAWRGGLLVALSGSWNATTISGYAIVWLSLAQPSVQLQVIPNYYGWDAAALALRRVSFHPLQLMSIAVDANGWLYTALAEGYIYRFRPR